MGYDQAAVMPGFAANNLTSGIRIRGWGMVTPLGHSAWETFQALLRGRTLPERAPAYVRAGGVEGVGLVQAMGATSVSQHAAIDPAIELAERAGREAFTMAGVKEAEWAGIPVYLGVSKGAIGAMGKAWERILGGHAGLQRQADALPPGDAARTMDPRGAVTLGPVGFMAAHLRQRMGLGAVLPVMGACASSLIALHLARLEMMKEGGPRHVLVLTAEAALYPVFIHSYKRLGVIPPWRVGKYVGRPLDRDRKGFMLSELAAAMLLEKVSGAADVPPDGSGRELMLTDTAIAGEGVDLMQPAPNMPALEHVAAQLLQGRTLEVLHPHATGTVDNDEAELAVYDRVLRKLAAKDLEGRLPAYAVKGALGHGLGAAGLVSLAVACMIAKAQRLPPMPWLHHPLPFLGVLRREGGELAAPGLGDRSQAVFAAGFGGHVAGAVVTSCSRSTSSANRG